MLEVTRVAARYLWYMENANANVKRIDIMLFTEFKNIVEKDENVATVLSICMEHCSKARNRDLHLANT